MNNDITKDESPARLIKDIVVDRKYEGTSLADKIIARAPWAEVTIADDNAAIRNLVTPDDNYTGYGDELNRGKHILHLTRNRGQFLKRCPATREYRCCDYQVINIGMNCPLDCTYCILQAYLNNPWLSFFLNTDDMLRELAPVLAEKKINRVGTGEFTDSLVLDRLTGLSVILIKKFRRHRHAILELKTKTVEIANLLSVDPEGHCLVSWSLNAPEVAKTEELRTASLNQRLQAAAKVAANGYHLGFHFDPVIFHPGWEEGYRNTIARLFTAVPAEKIVWISVGAFRFLPELKKIATARFPGSDIYYEEFITGLDNKYRYFRTMREDLYATVVNGLKEHAHPGTCIYFCMESDEIWQRVMGFTPEEQGGVPAMLDRAAAGALTGEKARK